MLNPSAAAYDAAAENDDDIDPTTGLPRQRPAAPAPTVDTGAPAPAPPAAQAPAAGPDDVLPPAAATDAPGDAAATDAPAHAPLPDLTPSKVDAPPDIQPPAGARQKFQRTLESPEDKAISADQDKLTGAALTAEQNASQVRQQAIKDEQAFRAQQTADGLDHQKRVQDTLAQHDADVQAALAKKQEYFDAARGAQFHDLWAERGAGDRVLGALAVFLGGLGGGDNKALGILNAQMQHAYDKQAADIDQKWKLYGEQSKNVESAQRGKAEAISDLNLLQSARYEVAADQLEQMKIRQGIPAEQAASDKNVVAIRQKALDIRAQEAKDTRDRVEWDTYGKARRGGSGGGAGAGGGLTELIKMKEEGKPDSEISARADELKIPAGGKNGWREATKEVRVGTAGAARIGLGEDKQINALTRDWSKENNVPKVIAAHDKLAALQSKLSTKNPDPLTVKSALMELDSAMRQGTATGASMNAIQGSLGGVLDRVRGWAEHGETGNFAPEQIAIIKKAVDEALRVNAEEGKSLHDTYMSRFYGDSKLQGHKESIAAESESLFGRWGFKSDTTKARAAGGQGAAAAAPVRAAVPADPQERSAKAQRAAAVLSDPTKTPEQRKLAQDYLTSVGQR